MSLEILRDYSFQAGRGLVGPSGTVLHPADIVRDFPAQSGISTYSTRGGLVGISLHPSDSDTALVLRCGGHHVEYLLSQRSESDVAVIKTTFGVDIGARQMAAVAAAAGYPTTSLNWQGLGAHLASRMGVSDVVTESFPPYGEVRGDPDGTDGCGVSILSGDTGSQSLFLAVAVPGWTEALFSDLRLRSALAALPSHTPVKLAAPQEVLTLPSASNLDDLLSQMSLGQIYQMTYTPTGGQADTCYVFKDRGGHLYFMPASYLKQKVEQHGFWGSFFIQPGLTILNAAAHILATARDTAEKITVSMTSTSGPVGVDAVVHEDDIKRMGLKGVSVDVDFDLMRGVKAYMVSEGQLPQTGDFTVVAATANANFMPPNFIDLFASWGITGDSWRGPVHDKSGHQTAPGGENFGKLYFIVTAFPGRDMPPRENTAAWEDYRTVIPAASYLKALGTLDTFTRGVQDVSIRQYVAGLRDKFLSSSNFSEEIDDLLRELEAGYLKVLRQAAKDWLRLQIEAQRKNIQSDREAARRQGILNLLAVVETALILESGALNNEQDLTALTPAAVTREKIVHYALRGGYPQEGRDRLVVNRQLLDRLWASLDGAAEGSRELSEGMAFVDRQTRRQPIRVHRPDLLIEEALPLSAADILYLCDEDQHNLTPNGAQHLLERRINHLTAGFQSQAPVNPIPEWESPLEAMSQGSLELEVSLSPQERKELDLLRAGLRLLDMRRRPA